MGEGKGGRERGKGKGSWEGDEVAVGMIVCMMWGLHLGERFYLLDRNFFTVHNLTCLYIPSLVVFMLFFLWASILFWVGLFVVAIAIFFSSYPGLLHLRHSYETLVCTNRLPFS